VWDGNRCVRKDVARYGVFNFGEALVEWTADPDGVALTTTYEYGAGGDAYGKLIRKTRSDGYWERYFYGSQQRLVELWTPLGNHTEAEAAAQGLRRRTQFGYSPNEAGDDLSLEPSTPRLVIEESISGTRRRYTVLSPGQRKDSQNDLYEGYHAPGYLETLTRYYTNGPQANRLLSVSSPEGTVQLFEYLESTNGWLRTNVLWQGAPGDAAHTNVVEGTRTISVSDRRGALLSREVFDVAGGQLLDRQAHTLDEQGRTVRVDFLDGTFEGTGYTCCGNVGLFTNRDGSILTYEYDELRRLSAEHRFVSPQAALSTLYERDAAGSVLRVSRLGTNGTPILLERAGYDGLQRPLARTNAAGHVTTYQYDFDTNGQTVVTTTLAAGTPEAGTRIETYLRDGMLARLTGTAVRPQRHAVFWDSSIGGDAFQRVALDTNFTDTAENDQTTRDGHGRPKRLVRASGRHEFFYYDGLGRLVRHHARDPGPAGGEPWEIHLFSYNAQGQRLDTALDLNANGVIDYPGADRITRTTNDVIFSPELGAVVRRTRTWVWPTNNLDFARLLSTVEITADGLLRREVAFGRTNLTQLEYLPGAQRQLTERRPDGSTTQTLFAHGRLVSTLVRDAASNVVAGFTCDYDAHGRKAAVTDLRNGPTAYTYTDLDQVATLTTPAPGPGQAAQVTTYFYDARGRLSGQVLADGTTVTNLYYPTDDLRLTHGSRTYPQEYSYDAQGRLRTLTTWQDFSNGLGAAVTEWRYDPLSGLLTNKLHAGQPGESYGYYRGLLSSRKLARAELPVELYEYNRAGEVDRVRDPNDGFGYLRYTRDRLGRVEQVDQGATYNGADPLFTVRYTYNEAGQLLAEGHSGGPLDGITLTNTYDALLRREALTINHQLQSLSTTSYGYDGLSRLVTVTNGPNTAAYEWLGNSTLLSNLVLRHNGAVRLSTTWTHDPLDRLQGISSSSSSSYSSSHTYAYNSANQRTAMTNADQSRWEYGYDALGQVTSANRYWPDAGGPNAVPVAGQQFEYAYDDIGNRRSAGQASRLAPYTNNLLNQIDSRSVPGWVPVAGEAHSNATVTLNDQPTLRHGRHYWGEVNVANSNGPLWTPITNLAVLQTPAGDMLTNVVGHLLVPPDPQVFQYDADGNLTNDGLWHYQWDQADWLKANRLRRIESLPTVPEEARQRLDFRYDYRGRRILKVVSPWNPFTLDYEPATTNKYVWDDWQLVAELDGTNGLVRSYGWGLDLSGTPQGAGGVGGLLFVTQHSTPQPSTHFPAYDGNGNVVGLVDAADGVVSAQYEYGPFGELLRATGPQARANLFRFSTKYQDDETGLLYYGFRYYDPPTGRWLSRDPIREDGGLNLTRFADNTGINAIDDLGLGVIYIVEAGGSKTITYTPPPPSSFWSKVWSGDGNAKRREVACKSKCDELKKLLGKAYVAADVYVDRDGVEHVPGAPNYERLSDQQLAGLGIDPRTLINAESGFYAALYKDHISGGYLVAFRGTEVKSGKDWLTDLNQGVGLPDTQYNAAASLGLTLGVLFPGQVSGVGHSLGGGLNTVAALRGNYPAVNFNAAGVHPYTARRLKLNLNNAGSLITNYSVPGDILSRGLNRTYLAPFTDGQQVLLPSPGSAPLSVNRHVIDNVIAAIQRALAQNGCK
jgi:RHS repeat-associated protein